MKSLQEVIVDSVNAVSEKKNGGDIHIVFL